MAIFSWAMSSCGTIVGGSKYKAHIRVVNDPKARISVDGRTVGVGEAVIRFPRKRANEFVVSVSSEDCETQVFPYKTRSFRGWALAGTILFWTGSSEGGVPLPFGLALDALTGSLWKPNVAENGVSKINYDNYKYSITYQGCENKSQPVPSNASPSDFKEILDVLYLKNGSIIRGVIYEMIPNTSVRIRTKDGNTFQFNFPEIEKMTKE